MVGVVKVSKRKAGILNQVWTPSMKDPINRLVGEVGPLMLGFFMEATGVSRVSSKLFFSFLRSYGLGETGRCVYHTCQEDPIGVLKMTETLTSFCPLCGSPSDILFETFLDIRESFQIREEEDHYVFEKIPNPEI